MQTVAYKYKVYRQNRNHEKRLSELMRAAASIYNHTIALMRRYYRLFGKSVSMFRMQAHIAKMKRRCFYNWGIVNSQSVQQIIERIYNGYAAFFKRNAKRPPSFKSWRKYRSVTYKNSGWKLNGNTLLVTKQKLLLKFHMSRPIDGKIQTVSLKQDAVGDWWLTFTIRKEDSEFIQKKAMTGRTAGFDFGLKRFLTASDGNAVESPLPLFHALDELRKKSRKFSRKRKGSNSRAKARLELSRLHRRVTNQRNAFHWQLANQLVNQYDAICLETLNIKAMQRIWGRKVTDLGFSDFVCILSAQCTKYGKRLVQIDQWEATSKTCSACGHKEEHMPLNIRKWQCPVCGTAHDRDVNAARNILRVGTSTLVRGGVSLAPQAASVDDRIPLL